MIDWLVKRLTPAKAEIARWVELAEAIQELWAEGFDPGYEELQGMLSIYTMSPADLAAKVRELGDYFRPDNPTENDQPLALAWKREEIRRKDTEFILKSVFRRNFSDLRIEWIPVYANKTKQYGEDFKAKTDLKEWELALSYYMTSRGQIRADLGHIHSLGMTKDKFLEYAEPLVFQYKPEHIVYDGALFYLNLPIEHPVIPVSFFGDKIRQHKMVLDFALRFDFTAADAEYLDTKRDLDLFYENESWPNLFFVPDTYKTHLDPYVAGDGIPCDWLPLDLMHKFDKEDDPFPTLDVPFVEKFKTFAPCVWGE